MNWCYLTFRSITPAQRGEAALRRAGIGCTLQRTPKALAERGCGYCLRLWQSEADRAAAVLEENQVPWSKRYCQGPDGSMEEAP